MKTMIIDKSVFNGISHWHQLMYFINGKRVSSSRFYHDKYFIERDYEYDHTTFKTSKRIGTTLDYTIIHYKAKVH